MKRIVSISLGSSQRDYQFTTTVLGQHVLVRRIGTNGDVRRIPGLLRELDGRVDVFGLEGLTPMFRVGRARYPHREAAAIAGRAQRTPVVYGEIVRSVLDRRAIGEVRHRLGPLSFRRVLVTAGLRHYALAEALAAAGAALRFGDPIVHLATPLLPAPRTMAQLDLYAAVTLPLAALLPYRALYPPRPGRGKHHPRAARLFAWADALVGDFAHIRHFAPCDLAGAVVVTTDPSPGEIAEMKGRGAAALATLGPRLSEGRPHVSADVLEAIAVAIMEVGGEPAELDLAEFIEEARWGPEIYLLADDTQRTKPGVIPARRGSDA